jgi:TetR/AcrR family transcriptional regulator, transcriptional repressor for nem operon
MAELTATGRIVDRAKELFRVHGYHHTSPDQVMAAAQVSKSTFYYHFRSKAELGRAVLDAQERSYWKHRLLPSIGDPSRPAAERLRDWFRSSAEAFEAREFRGGCPFAILGLELADENEALRTRLHEILMAWRGPLMACIGDGIASGQIRNDLAPEALAELLIAQYEGALVLAVIGKTAEPLRLASEIIPALLAGRGGTANGSVGVVEGEGSCP